jgi:hypothetical protein
MGLFWNYFKHTLRWAPIWPAGALSAVTEGAAASLDDVRENELWLRSQFVPEKCMDSHLAAHALSRAIDNQHYRETSSQFRTRVSLAKAWHEKGGKTRGLEEILSYYGFPDTVVFNLRVEDSTRWAEFRLYVRPTFPMLPADYDLLNYISNEFKAASAKLESISVEIDAEVPAWHGIEVVSATYQAVEIDPDGQLSPVISRVEVNLDQPGVMNPDIDGFYGVVVDVDPAAESVYLLSISGEVTAYRQSVEADPELTEWTGDDTVVGIPAAGTLTRLYLSGSGTVDVLQVRSGFTAF